VAGNATEKWRERLRKSGGKCLEKMAGNAEKKWREMLR
jgi:hypothetical protein